MYSNCKYRPEGATCTRFERHAAGEIAPPRRSRAPVRWGRFIKLEMMVSEVVRPCRFRNRDPAADSHIKCIVDDAVHNGFGAIALKIRIDSPVPALRFVLSTEYHGAVRLLSTAGLHYFQKVIGFLQSKTVDKPIANTLACWYDITIISNIRVGNGICDTFNILLLFLITICP